MANLCFRWKIVEIEDRFEIVGCRGYVFLDGGMSKLKNKVLVGLGVSRMMSKVLALPTRQADDD